MSCNKTITEIELLQREVAQLNQQLYAAYQRIAQLEKEKSHETQSNNQIQHRQAQGQSYTQA